MHLADPTKWAKLLNELSLYAARGQLDNDRPVLRNYHGRLQAVPLERIKLLPKRQDFLATDIQLVREKGK